MADDPIAKYITRYAENRWAIPGLTSRRNFVCTIRFEGTILDAVAERFAVISGSEPHHLFHNLHELTWSKLHLDDSRNPVLPHTC